MPFSNEVIGTNGALIRNWMKSENYVAGVSGWQITKSGNAEFNDGIFRGSIEAGPNPGAHFVVNNPSTGDVIDVYDSANRLDFLIDRNGQLVSQNAGSSPGLTLSIQGGVLAFDDNNVNIFGPSISIDSGNAPHQRAGLGLQSGVAFFPSGPSLQLDLIADSVGNLYAMSNQRGVFGTLMQNDSGPFNGTNQLMHADSYAATSDGTGHATFAHGCSFTPTFALFGGGLTNNVFVGIWPVAFTATTVTVKVNQAYNTPYVGGFSAEGLFIG